MEHANPAAILFMLLFCGPVLFFIFRAKRGAEIFIRRIAGIDALDEAVGRAVELGKPMVFTSGNAQVDPLLYASLGVLRYIARKAAIFGSKLLVPCMDSEVLVMTEAAVQNAYRQENKLSRFDPTTIRYLSRDQFAYASGYMGLVHREKVASTFLFGSFAAESLILAEAGQQVGAIQVAATVDSPQVPFFITSCDYTLIGEELFAAGAFLSKDPVQTGSLRGQDIAKLIVLCFVILGVIEATFFGHGKAELTLHFINSSWSDLFVTKAGGA